MRKEFIDFFKTLNFVFSLHNMHVATCKVFVSTTFRVIASQYVGNPGRSLRSSIFAGMVQVTCLLAIILELLLANALLLLANAL